MDIQAPACPVLDVGQTSRIGGRTRNEDFHGVMFPDAGFTRLGILACIADGVGSCADGRYAAETTVRTLLNDYYATPATWRGVRALYEVTASINAWLHGEGRRRGGGLATTLTAALFRGRTLSLLHVGDSRCYRLRNGRWECLTRDHVFGGADLAVLTKAVGIDDRFTPDVAEEALLSGDRYLLVTDGVWRELTGSRLAETLSASASAQIAAEAALRSGAGDNTTALAVFVEALPEGAAEDVLREWSGMPVMIPPAPGQVIDGFRILRRLHKSHLGVVLAAVDEATGQDVVLKFPDPLLSAEPAWLEGFAREEWAGLRLRHHNVVRVLAQPAGRRTACYYVMESLDGCDLQALIDHAGRPEPHQVADWLRQAAAGLMALHRRGIIHRDIKPENLFLTRAGRLVLVDFGSLRIDGLSPLRESGLQGRIVGGTPGFMAPELYQGEAGDVSSDLFALAATGYLLLTGKPPYGRPEPNVTPAFTPPQPVRTLRPETPEALAHTIECCLAPHRHRRPGDAGEFLAMLEKVSLPVTRMKPLLERDPLRFYQIGFWIFFATTLISLLNCR